MNGKRKWMQKQKCQNLHHLCMPVAYHVGLTRYSWGRGRKFCKQLRQGTMLSRWYNWVGQACVAEGRRGACARAASADARHRRVVLAAVRGGSRALCDRCHSPPARCPKARVALRRWNCPQQSNHAGNKERKMLLINWPKQSGYAWLMSTQILPIPDLQVLLLQDQDNIFLSD